MKKALSIWAIVGFMALGTVTLFAQEEGTDTTEQATEVADSAAVDSAAAVEEAAPVEEAAEETAPVEENHR